MKKLAVLASGLFLFLGTAMSQSAYKVHVIKEGETLTKLANRYGTTVGDIMRLNKMTTDSKLYIGEEVKIPVSNDDAVAVVPSTHEVQKGETLYQLSRKYGVSVNDLRDWNNIEGNTIKVGQVLRLAPSGENSLPVAANTSGIPAAKADTKKEDIATVTDTQSAGNDDAAPAKERNTSVFDPVGVSASAEGVYGDAYKSQANGTELITKGTAAIFKSASGWKDKKYFVLMNEVSPGTVVKVQANGKTVYAKVLWNLGNVKENAGLSYRISDAAADALGLSGDEFNIIVSYFK